MIPVKFLLTLIHPLVRLLTNAAMKLAAFFMLVRWRDAEAENKQLRKDAEIYEKAKKIDTVVEFDPDYRQRVRREYDQP